MPGGKICLVGILVALLGVALLAVIPVPPPAGVASCGPVMHLSDVAGARFPSYAHEGQSIRNLTLEDFLEAGATSLARLHEPFVIRGGIDEEGFADWVPSFENDGSAEAMTVSSALKRYVDGLACRQASNPFFTYYQSDRPMSSLSSVQALESTAPRVLDRVSTCALNAKMFGRQTLRSAGTSLDGCDLLYYSAPIGASNAKLVSGMDLSSFLVEEAEMVRYYPEHLPGAKLMYWMGSAGTVTRMHYDWSHNFHILAHGKKQFRLYPPSDAWQLRQYPYLHPRATKSQDGFSNGPRFDNVRLSPLDVVVGPGDVLYIPPLWFHEVVALEPTMSLAVWSPSHETLMVNQALAIGIPFNTDMMSQGDQVKANALAAFLHVLITTIELNGRPGTGTGVDTTVSFVTKLLDSRYYPLETSTPELFASDAPFSCPSAKWLGEAEDSYHLQMYFKEHVQEVFFPLLGGIPKDRRDVWLADFVEVSVNFIVGLDNVVSFLECLAFAEE